MVKPIGGPDDGAEDEEVLMRMDGFDDCIIGLCHRAGNPSVIAYDLSSVVQQMQKEGLTFEEAIEFFEYNQLGAYMGPMTPVFIDTDVELLEHPDLTGL
jgi:hypothetical protein